MHSAYAYLRISTEDQSNFSIEAQEEIIRKYASNHNFTIQKVYTDDGVSAKNFNRPAWKKLELDLSKSKGEIKAIIVAKYDRLIRNAAEGLTLLERFEIKLHVQIISAGENFYIDPHSPFYFKIRADMFVNAEFERRVIADRTKMGIWQAKKQGRFLGVAPFGYKNARDSSNKPIIVINPIRATIVRQLFENIAIGMDWKQAGKIAKQNGFTLSGKDSVKWVLNNILYAGIIEVPAYAREPAQQVKGIHEPIISEEVFYKVQAALHGKPQPKTKERDEFPLRGVLCCQQCNNPLTAGLSRGRLGGLFPYYRCRKCKGENYNANKVHEIVIRILTKLSLPVDQIQNIREKAEKQMEQRLSIRLHNAERLKIEIRELEVKLMQLEEKYITDRIEESTYKKYSGIWRRDLDGKKVELEHTNTDEHQYWESFYKNLNLLSDIAGLFSTATFENKQRIMRMGFAHPLQMTKYGLRTPAINPLLHIEPFKINGLEVTDEQKNRESLRDSLLGSGGRT